jgi:hypothetical protein
VTPRSPFPDILISVGLLGQLMAGEVSINKHSEKISLMHKASLQLFVWI